MATTFAVTKNEVLCNSPLLVRRLTCTGGDVALAYTHGEPKAPDLVIAQNVEDGAAPSAVAVVKTSATVVTMDTLVENSGDIEVYLIWLSQPGTGGLNPPT